MNIFYLNKNPDMAAVEHVDKHVVKMIVEYAQLLSTAKRMLDGIEYTDYSKNNRKIKRYRLENPNHDKVIYKACHYNHPSAVWVRENKLHYQWLYRLFKKLGHEYTHRYGKVHSTNVLLNQLLETPPNNIPVTDWKDPPPAMKHYPDCIVPGDSIQSYKNYYIVAKAYFAKWSKRETPKWFQEGIEQMQTPIGY
tara:strand:- start:612 stop:1193 length:582 start_codon:yes stop_codon:yes gene_type:complete